MNTNLQDSTSIHTTEKSQVIDHLSVASGPTQRHQQRTEPLPAPALNDQFARTVEDRFGVMPNFFCSAPAAEGLIEELWAFAKSAYLDSPLPSLFKERLFVYLSRFCPVRYCVVRHVGFLMGYGRPAGDATVQPQTVEQVIDLMSRPLPSASQLAEALSRLKTYPQPDPIPELGSPQEADLFHALAVVFLEPRQSSAARGAIKQAVGEAHLELLTAYLAFIRTAHYWTETHPELAYEPDMVMLMQEEVALAQLLLDPSEAELVQASERLRQTLLDLQTTQRVSANRQVLLQMSDRLRTLSGASQIQTEVAHLLQQQLQLDQVGYLLFDPAQPTRGPMAWVDTLEQANEATKSLIWNALSPLGTDQLHAGHPVIVANTKTQLSEGFLDTDYCQRRQVGALVAYPLIHGCQLTAMLYVTRATAHAWNAQEINLIEEVAERTREAIERWESAEALRQSEERYRLLSAKLDEQVRQRTQELETSNGDLQQSNENLQEFAYVASHDLQEPLRKIQQFGDLLKARLADSISPDDFSYLERMQSAASRMNTLIRDLLNYSRISTQRDSLAPVSLQTVLETVLTTLELPILETEAQIQISPLPVVSGDAMQLSQLFQNLLSNALKFQRTDQAAVPVTPKIQIQAQTLKAAELPTSIKPARTASAYYRIDVADNGVGFEEKYLDRIFKVFQRLHGKGNFAGTGIGLAICQKVVANHGGAITAHSQPGQGATFTVYLPV